MIGNSGYNGFSFNRAQYPDPFLDLASTKLPKSQQKLFELCHLFATTHPQIRPIVHKLAKYPITNLIVKSSDGQASLEKQWSKFLKHDLDIFSIAVQVGLDYFGYGNAFVVVHRPFIRVYACVSCGHEHPAGQLDYFINNKTFIGTCKSCKTTGKVEPKDLPTSVGSDISVTVIPPQEMRIETNRSTNQSRYLREVPGEVRNAIKNGKKPNRFIIDTTPYTYIQAALEKKFIFYGKNKILHLREPGLSSDSSHWGSPIIMAALKDAYLNQVLKKSDEAITHERTVPRRFVYPDVRSSDPMQTIGLARWAAYMQKMIAVSRHDPNAIMPTPFPVGVTELGGNTQQLVTPNLRELVIREIIGSTGVPESFWSGEMTYSGGSVQGRMFENMIGPYTRQQDRLLRHIVNNCARILDWPEVEVKWKEFKKADDIQSLSLLMNLVESKHVSAREILERMDMNWDDQHEIIKKESAKIQQIRVQEALIETKVALESIEYQAAAQARQEGVQILMGQVHSFADEAGNQLSQHKSFTEADEIAAGLITLDRAERQEALANLSISDKKKAEKVKQAISEMYGGGLISELVQSSSSPEELAQKIMMLPSTKRIEAFSQLQKSDPTLAVRVSESLRGGGGGSRNRGSKTSVDSRPLPEQKPPRRK